MRAGARALTNNDVELEVLHRGVEDFFDIWLKPVNLIDKQHITEFQIRQNGGQVAFHLDQRPSRGAEVRSHFVRDHGRKSRLAQSRRAV